MQQQLYLKLYQQQLQQKQQQVIQAVRDQQQLTQISSPQKQDLQQNSTPLKQQQSFISPIKESNNNNHNEINIIQGQQQMLDPSFSQRILFQSPISTGKQLILEQGQTQAQQNGLMNQTLLQNFQLQYQQQLQQQQTQQLQSSQFQENVFSQEQTNSQAVCSLGTAVKGNSNEIKIIDDQNLELSKNNNNNHSNHAENGSIKSKNIPKIDDNSKTEQGGCEKGIKADINHKEYTQNKSVIKQDLESTSEGSQAQVKRIKSNKTSQQDKQEERKSQTQIQEADQDDLIIQNIDNSSENKKQKIPKTKSPSNKSQCSNLYCKKPPLPYQTVPSKRYAGKIYQFCPQCLECFNKGLHCDYCEQVYENNESYADVKEWVGCESCQKWNHVDCEAADKNDQKIKKIYKNEDFQYYCNKCLIKQSKKINDHNYSDHNLNSNQPEITVVPSLAVIGNKKCRTNKSQQEDLNLFDNNSFKEKSNYHKKVSPTKKKIVGKGSASQIQSEGDNNEVRNTSDEFYYDISLPYKKKKESLKNRDLSNELDIFPTKKIYQTVIPHHNFNHLQYFINELAFGIKLSSSLSLNLFNFIGVKLILGEDAIKHDLEMLRCCVDEEFKEKYEEEQKAKEAWRKRKEEAELERMKLIQNRKNQMLINRSRERKTGMDEEEEEENEGEETNDRSDKSNNNINGNKKEEDGIKSRQKINGQNERDKLEDEEQEEESGDEIQSKKLRNKKDEIESGGIIGDDNNNYQDDAEEEDKRKEIIQRSTRSKSGIPKGKYKAKSNFETNGKFKGSLRTGRMKKY